jgi:hypothetical protein
MIADAQMGVVILWYSRQAPEAVLGSYGLASDLRLPTSNGVKPSHADDSATDPQAAVGKAEA